MTQIPRYLEGDYRGCRWLELHVPNILLYQLVTHCPEVLVGKHLAVTSMDSTAPALAVYPDWRCERNVLISPKLDHDQIKRIPIDEWSEWFLFDTVTPHLPLQFGKGFETFVNLACFSLASVDDYDWPEFWKGAGEHLQQVFWGQIHRLHPHSYIAEGDYLIYVTKDDNAFTTVRNWAMTL